MDATIQGSSTRTPHVLSQQPASDPACRFHSSVWLRSTRRLWAMIAGLALLGTGNAWAVAPVLYSQLANESPVRGEPGDLLLLAGYGFAATDTVVYVALTDTTQPLTQPTSVPTTSTATSGVAPVVSVLNVPHSLAVALPSVMQTKQSYALWVRNTSGEWSNGVRINDARPLWISPDHAYVTGQVASLPRYLKVIGRNLQAKAGAVTQVKLVGPTTYTLTAADDGNPATAIETYVANVTLPATVLAGNYSVSVSRDGVSWVPLSGQTLSVLPNPVSVATFSVRSYGCAPNDGVDDTSCIISAIAAARNNGGGTVTFDSGVWNVGNTNATGVTGDGILVPVGVNLTGAGAGVTTVQRDTTWDQTRSTFTLQGANTVQGFTFKDANVYQATSSAAPLLRLGVHWWAAHSYSANDPTYVSGVTITHNTFDKPFVAIGDGGLPIDHLFITYNEFGAYANDLSIDGDGNNTRQKYHIDDSIVALNTFKPGSYTDVSIGQGVIATGLSAGQRVDFSSNVADGTATQYLYNPGTDPKGWRAGFFWTMRGNIENLLVAQNTASCTGDKAGDGEGIAYDGNHNWNALPSAQAVTAATSNTVTAAGPLLAQQGALTFPGDYYSEYWVTVADGPGKGQVRKIVSYPLDASGAPITPITFTVSPAWDVIPQSTSRITVAKEFWQVYTVDNVIDQRQPLCTKLNPNKPMGGVITLAGQNADSAVEGNQQYDTSGVVLGNGYTVADNSFNPPLTSTTGFQSFVDLRGNTVDHEYQWTSDCSWSGIQAWYGAGPTAGSSPPTEGYGISISHNSITQADGIHGGAIVLAPTWYEGPPPTNWDLIESPLIFGNTINSITGPPASASPPYASCGIATPRLGINVADSHVFHAVLSSNSCSSVTTPLADLGTSSQRICSATASNPCECPVGASGYWKFDEGSGTTTADASGNGNGGTLVNGPTWTTGRTGSALNFSAATSYVAVNGAGNLANLYTTGMTITAWINPASAGGGGVGRIVDKDNNDRGWFFKMSGTTTLQFAADQFVANGSVPGSAATRTSGAKIVLNTWQHVAVTWDGTTNASNIHIYVNGVQSDGAAVNGSGIAGSDAGTPFTIGNRAKDLARNFNGSIDGLRIYNRMLSTAEIQSLVNGGS